MIDHLLQNGWEMLAVALGIAYLLLAVRQQLACWYAALASTTIYLFIFYSVDLYMESTLQLFYMAMAVYGWYQWQQGQVSASGLSEEQQGQASASGQREEQHDNLPISTWPLHYHLIAISLVLLASVISGTLLADTEQRLGYLDSFTTWGAIVATYMVTRKILENWLYWLVIDGVAIFLYLDRELYYTVLLFAVYEVIVIFGWFSWLKDYRQESGNS